MGRFPFRSRRDWETRLREGLVTQGNKPLQPGDRLLLHPPLQFLAPSFCEPAVPDETVILKQTEEYALVYKPAPLPVHPGGRYNKNTLLAILREKPDQHGISGGHRWGPYSPTTPENLWTVHRLDAVTSGLMVFGRCAVFSRKIQKAFAAGRIRKYYLAVVRGCPAVDRITIDKPVRRKTGFVFETADQGKASSTEIEVLLRGDKASLVKCIPHTGRTHQIRLHLHEWGHPVIDDPVYGLPGKRTPRESDDDNPRNFFKSPIQNTGISLLHYRIQSQDPPLDGNLFDYFENPGIPSERLHPLKSPSYPKLP